MVAVARKRKKELTDFILENKLTLKHLLCTHLHVDHVFGNGFIYKTYGLKPEANKQDVEKLPSPDEQAKLFGLRQHVENVPVEKYIVGGEIIKFGTSGTSSADSSRTFTRQRRFL